MERSTFLEYVACNTDMQALSSSLADTTITLGKNTARGLGAGGVPAVGRAAAIDASAEIEALVRGVDMVFVTAGMGGGTGSGAAPVVANLARAAGCLTIGVVTTPFAFEGRVRAEQVRAHAPAAAHHQRATAAWAGLCPSSRPIARHSATLPPPQSHPRAPASGRPARDALRRLL